MLYSHVVFTCTGHCKSGHVGQCDVVSWKILIILTCDPVSWCEQIYTALSLCVLNGAYTLGLELSVTLSLWQKKKCPVTCVIFAVPFYSISISLGFSTCCAADVRHCHVSKVKGVFLVSKWRVTVKRFFRLLHGRSYLNLILFLGDGTSKRKNCVPSQIKYCVIQTTVSIPTGQAVVDFFRPFLMSIFVHKS